VREYRPQQRLVRSSIFTSIGWLTGTFHCNLKQALVDYLNLQASFFRLTDVTLPGVDAAIPFLALQKSKVIVLAPMDSETNLEKRLPGEINQYAVTCVLQDGVLSGTLRTRPNQRLSDHLTAHNGFFVLRECYIRGRNDAVDSIVKRISVAIVNDTAVIGITEDR